MKRFNMVEYISEMNEESKNKIINELKIWTDEQRKRLRVEIKEIDDNLVDISEYVKNEQRRIIRERNGFWKFHYKYLNDNEFKKNADIEIESNSNSVNKIYLDILKKV
ncbi:hypothetical protein [Mycoplasma sp. CSL7503-lung]|uniref:hypothetical protein n=1 Tax=Mycoplasma sp. CSL7503-lung TaxID=536372 RepID=UPI0021D0661D|nr:hypothetical protein [Mycoplasma sp. CSL7503-lung]MCU4706442.1 hypothetical protein [Mycoplasma sp. CSL7503-lung]